MFDAEKFGEAMGELARTLIREAVAPLQASIEELKARPPQTVAADDLVSRIASAVMPSLDKSVADYLLAHPPAAGKDADMDAVFSRVDAALKAIPVPKNGVGISDIEQAGSNLVIKLTDGTMSDFPLPPGLKGDKGDSVKGDKGDPGESIKGDKGDPGESIKGEKGDSGKDGVGLAGAMIDRDGVLVITKSNGEAVKLGVVVGKDGDDGKDGLSVESLEREYDPQTHEVVERWSFGGRTKEMRYPAGGIRAGGYWREGTKAVAGEAWTQGGSLWIAKNDTTDKPDIKSESWFLAARAGRDGERGMSGKDGSPPAPISLRARA